ncbi:Abi family protein [Clostridium gasigenes]|uniref:Abi family protein n=1 Tax=Clostridium gasigenes TaxID=94869 RepID=UPI001C0BD5FA|nr:Abi family protein [Clostridium gasigenes]MBU3133401.1 Abi family protein [Clostridium gasigenes]
MSDIKNIDSLVTYLNNVHNIKTNNTIDKQALMNIGYYHGYKGYRFIKTPSNPINYSNFAELLAVNKFDINLKALFYPHIMFIETAIKNYVLESILDTATTDCFNIIFETILTDYKNHKVSSKNYKISMKRRLNLRNQIFSVLTRDYNNNKPIIQHFYHKDKPVPIWAIFEVISLGEFGNFIACINPLVKNKISISLNLNQSCDANNKLIESIIYQLKDLRNSIAHNNVIFDTRFKSNKANKSLITSLQLDTKINNISFDTLVDYLILIIHLLKNLNTNSNELLKIVDDFQCLLDNFRGEIPISIYSQIFYTDTRNKLTLLKEFASK